MNIDELLNRYFEGETSAEEEQKLRRFFASDNVPENLSAYKPLFAYFDEEITAERDMAEEIWSEIAPEALPEKRWFMSCRQLLLVCWCSWESVSCSIRPIPVSVQIIM